MSLNGLRFGGQYRSPKSPKRRKWVDRTYAIAAIVLSAFAIFVFIFGVLWAIIKWGLNL